ncbi:MAG: hypothetical protein ACFFE8_12345 [Candidatus Heimdallarchaeota archaeon]
MLKDRLRIIMGMLVLASLFAYSSLVLPSSAALTLNWHESVKEGGQWRFKVSNYSGEVTTFFPALANVSEGSLILVNATGNPPTVGDWTSLVSSTNIAWVDIYIDGEPTAEENFVYFFVSPLDIGNDTVGWEAWVNIIAFITALMGLFDPYADYQNTTTSTANTITYSISNSGGTGNNQWAVSHEITYNNGTGILESYTFDMSNTTLSSSITISRETDSGLFPTPALTVPWIILFFFALVAVLPRRRSR